MNRNLLLAAASSTRLAGTSRNARAPSKRQRGAFVVEFALVAMMFFFLLFLILEISRALYMFNTLQEVTRRAARAAATTDFSDTSAMNALRRNAIFSNNAGQLLLGAPITDQHIVIDYLSLQNTGSTMTPMTIPSGALPGCPARNRLVCTADPGDPSCIRFVRVRVCQPGSSCTPVPYEGMSALSNFSLNLPVSTTLMRAESLGYKPGMPMCK